MKYDFDEIYPLSIDPKDTDTGWKIILDLCEDKQAFGGTTLDSFLSGPDLERRVELVVNESKTNEWLRGELKQAMDFEQKEMSPEQRDQLMEACGLAK